MAEEINKKKYIKKFDMIVSLRTETKLEANVDSWMNFHNYLRISLGFE